MFFIFCCGNYIHAIFIDNFKQKMIFYDFKNLKKHFRKNGLINIL